MFWILKAKFDSAGFWKTFVMSIPFKISVILRMSIVMAAAFLSTSCESTATRSVLVSPKANPAQWYEKVSRSLVMVQFSWQTALGTRSMSFPGVIVTTDGLVLLPQAAFDDRIPDQELKEFKIVVPQAGADPLEYPAIFQGRDERCRCAYVKAVKAEHWPAIHFVDQAISVGDPVFSLSLMGASSGYKALLSQATAQAIVQEEVTHVMISSNAPKLGSPIFGQNGDAIGLVLNEPIALAPQPNAPVPWPEGRYFVPTGEFSLSLADPPSPAKPTVISWLGVTDLHVVKSAELKYFGLTQPAIQVGDVVPQAPADLVGVKPGQLITRVNGHALDRGDNADLTPKRLLKSIAAKPPGDSMTFTVLDGKGATPREVRLQLQSMPRMPREVGRYWAQDFGFEARSVTFFDTYAQHLPAATPGVVASLVKPDGSAGVAGLKPGDLIMQFNGEGVTNLDQFTHSYDTLRRDHPGLSAVLMIRRDGAQQTIKIESGN